MCRLHRGLSVIWLCAISSTLFAPAKFTDKASGVVATGSAKVKIIKQLAVKGGKVETSKNGTLEGTKVVYNAGKLIQENSTNIDITGEFNPDEDTVTLADQKFNASPGNIAQDVHLSGNSLLEGTPTNFASSTGVKIANASTVLNLALTSPLGTNIDMNGGTVKLQGSTKLGDGKTPLGNGVLEFNKNSLSLGGTPVTLSGKLTLKKAADLIFNSKVTVTGQLTFDGDGQVSGNGNLMDISLGGTLAIRPNTTIYMTNLKLRGLGLGKIMFYDDTSQLYMSNVEVEMDRNYSVTIGGIYMEGPTNIVTKNNRLAFSLRGSLTVDGIALTYDTLTFTNGNNIVPLVANDPNHKFVTVLNGGVIRRLDNFDIISGNSSAIRYLTNLVRTSSNVWAPLIRQNSGAIGYLTTLARATSGSVGYLTKFARANSSGVVYLTSLARSSSGSIGYLTSLARATSGSVGYLTKFARANSGGVTYLTTLARTSSNALLFGDRANSGGVVYLTSLARSSSGSIGYLTSLARATSGSVGYLTKFARANSGGVAYLTTLARTSSNALLLGDRANSGGVVYLTALARSSSGSIGYLTSLARATSGSVGYLTKFARANSGGVAYLTTLARTSSNALLLGDRANSGAIAYLSTQVRVNSNTMIYGFNQIGAELDILAETVRTHSNAFTYGITNNSQAIALLDQLARADSNASAYGIKNNSNTLLYLHRVDSSAVVALTSGQTALVQTVRTDSNASVYGIKNNSNTLLYLHRVDSSAVVALTAGQAALAQTVRTDSNASVYGIKNNSNTLLYLHRVDSSAVVALTAGQTALVQTVRTDSNASMYGIKNNSNTLLYLHRVDSAAVVALTDGQAALAQTVRTDSNASMYGIKNNSNTMLYGFGEVGAELDALTEMVRTHSNSFAYGITNNSNAIIKLGSGGANALSLANSNALLYLHRVDSGAIVKLASGAGGLVTQNSNAIVRLNNQAQLLYGPDPLIVATAPYVLSTNVYLSSDHMMFVQSGAGSCTIDGGGHTISFANAQTDLMQVDPGIVVTLTNVVLNNYSEAAVLLGSGSSVQFGANVQVVLASDQSVTRDWAFAGGNTMVAGNGNRLTLGTGSIVVRPSSLLRLQAVGLDGLKNSNVRCDDTSSSLVLEASDLYLTNNMSFSSGVLDIAQDVRVTGTNTFTFNSDQALLVESASALRLDGITFVYQPSTDNRDALVLTDRSSVLALDGCTLQSTTTGMRLTRGTLVVDSTNKLVNTGATSLSEGFCFGNGNPDDDLAVQIKPGASLNLQTGGLIDYANVN